MPGVSNLFDADVLVVGVSAILVEVGGDNREALTKFKNSGDAIAAWRILSLSVIIGARLC
jgi:hypothetical protein